MSIRCLTSTVLATIGLFLLATFAPTASAATTVAEKGEEAGQVHDPEGVAVDQSTGIVYVADNENHRVDEFGADGTFIRAFGFGVRDGKSELQTCGPQASPASATCLPGQSGSEPGEIRPSEVAVDPSTHDVYAYHYGEGRIEKFTTAGQFLAVFGEGHLSGTSPLAVDAEGHVWAGGVEALSEFSSAGAFIKEVTLAEAGEVVSLAIDASNHFFTLRRAVNESQNLNTEGSSGEYTLTFKGQTTTPIPVGAEAATVQKALEALSSIGAGNVRVEGRGFGAIVEFVGALGGQNVEQLVPSGGNPAVTVETEPEGVAPLVAERNETGTVLRSIDTAGYPNAIGLDSAAGRLYVSEQANPHAIPPGPATLLAFNTATGAQTEAFGEGEVLGAPLGNALAFGHGAALLYVVGGEVLQSFKLPAAGPTVAAGSTKASEVRKRSATLTAKVNPEHAATTYHFQYIAKAQFEADGSTFGAGTQTTPESTPLGEDFAPHTASSPVSGLTLGTPYELRVIAHNSNGTATGETAEFTTLPIAAIDSESVSNVSATSATLEAQINPLGDATTYQFEYVTAKAFEEHGFAGATSVPSPAASIGSGSEDVTLAPQRLQGLAANTPYDYRVSAHNALGTQSGATQTFTTQVVVSGATLPDGRQWELVSPPDKHGAVLQGIGAAGVVQASRAGDAVTYRANSPTSEAGVKGYYEAVQVLSDRGPGGWSSQDISLPHASVVPIPVEHGGEYRFFSEDLSQGLAEPIGGYTSLAPEVSPADTEKTAYVRHDATCNGDPKTCFEPLLTGAAGYADVPKGTHFGTSFSPGEQAHTNGFISATEDLSNVVFDSLVALTVAPTSAYETLYEWSGHRAPAQRLSLVSVLPESEGGATVPAFLGDDGVLAPNPNARHAISADGSRVFWTPHGTENPYLYMRDTVKEKTIRLDLPEAACLATQECGRGNAKPKFQLANRDGSVVFFTDEQALTAGSGAMAGKRDLYECVIVETAGTEECVVHDLTPAVGGERAQVQGLVPGASEDSTYVYFVADGKLAAGAVHGGCTGKIDEPTGAECNLYMLHRDSTGAWEAPRLVAVLSGGVDSNDWGGPVVSLRDETARVSGNGRFAVFMSARSLTGYDNRDVVSGHLDGEVFMFDASSGRVVCVSCNPSGARPAGREAGNDGLVYGFDVWNGQWLAANVPGWTPYEGGGPARYQSRYLSDEGRVFFNSSDALVPQDVNNNQDVYEFEPVGVGGCSASSSTFSQVSGGCVALISSGTASGESAFLDASETGGDVFFLTGEKLVPQDLDTATDVYDAHVCTTGSPCVSAPVPPPPCATADACRAAPRPQPSIFGSPASATFSGQGNAPPSGSAVKRKSRALTRVQKLARSLKACKRERSRSRRKACERAAHRRYGSHAKSKPRKGSR